MLFYYVDKTVHTSNPKEHGYILSINAFLAVILIIIGVLWWNGVVENREKAIPTFTQTEQDLIEEKVREVVKETLENSVNVDISISGESQEVKNKEVPQTGE